ncbi:MAG: hypothetical protein LUF91_03020, partial [Oscillospiraceae bacterium]|nr:hypothetical protein [Oscillospiraceae bacterium]
VAQMLMRTWLKYSLTFTALSYLRKIFMNIIYFFSIAEEKDMSIFFHAPNADAPAKKTARL